METMEENTSKTLLWARYIDDVFVLWRGDARAFMEFVDKLNDNNIGLRFTFELNEYTIPFRYVLISRAEDGSLDTKIFCKGTATDSLLRWVSCHPKSPLKGIPKG